MRLLIVEDNQELAGLLAKGLQTAGYEADILSTVEEATNVLRTTFYAALILDLGLPDGDGLALLRELRHRNNPIPVLVLTARGGLHDRVHGLRSGADDYLVKPFALEELVARLEEVGTKEVKGYLGDLVASSGQALPQAVSRALLRAMPRFQHGHAGHGRLRSAAISP